MSLFSLKKLTITNFRAVIGTIIVEFSQLSGLYFVSGRNEVEPQMGANGVGKSSIYTDALSWVLNGRTSRSQRPGSEVECRYSDGPTGIVCEFSLGNEQHIIERWRNPTKLLLDGERIEQKVIDDLLPFSDSALRRTLLIDQFGQMFLNLRPEEKSRIFSETLQLDIWLKGSANCSGLISQIDREIVKTEQGINSFKITLSELKDQLEISRKNEYNFEQQRSIERERLLGQFTKAELYSKETREGLDKAREAQSKLDLGNKKIELNDKRREERQLINTLAQLKTKINNQIKLKKEYTTKLSQYTNTNICPECGQTVTDEHIKQKRSELEEFIAKLDSGYQESVKDEPELSNLLTKLQIDIADLEQILVLDTEAQVETAKWAERSLSADREFNSVKKQIELLKKQVNTWTEQCGKLELRSAELQQSRTKLEEDLSILNTEIEIYRFWERGFREIRLEQIDTTLMELELAANRHAESLGLSDWEIQFATERETVSGNISHKFSVFLFPPGSKDPVAWETYSGGESQRWQLAVTFALAEVLLSRAGIDTDIEIIDEPSQHLSQEGIDDLLQCLKDRAIDCNRRIFVIDHHVLDSGAFDGVIQVVKTREGVRLQ